MLVWRKLSSAKWEDAWLERLGFIDPQHVVVTALAGAKTIRIEAYDISKKDAEQLVKRFGGQTRVLQNRNFVADAAKPRPPLLIRDTLVVVRSENERAKLEKQFPDRHVLAIPAAMAFGTGDHATTANCLRFLCDTAETNSGKSWEMLDLGTGTGILAITARKLGAKRIDAYDFDPACIRTTRENAALNGVKLHAIQKVDVLKWTPSRQWDVVTANLFSGVLIAAAAKIARATKRGGHLIFSGILREQEHECIRAFRAQRFDIREISRRGKWVTALARR